MFVIRRRSDGKFFTDKHSRYCPEAKMEEQWCENVDDGARIYKTLAGALKSRGFSHGRFTDHERCVLQPEGKVYMSPIGWKQWEVGESPTYIQRVALVAVGERIEIGRPLYDRG